MTTPRNLWVAAATVLMMACSRDRRLVGQWVREPPGPVYLNFRAMPKQYDGYEKNLVYIEADSVRSAYWRIRRESPLGDVLYVAVDSMLDAPPQGALEAKAVRHRIVALTQERLVLEWRRPRGAGDTSSEVYEFQRSHPPASK